MPDSIFFADPLTVGDPVLAQWDAEEVHFLQSGAQRRARAEHATRTASWQPSRATDVRAVRRVPDRDALGRRRGRRRPRVARVRGRHERLHRVALANGC